MTAATQTSRAAYHDIKATGFHGQHAWIVSHLRPGKIYSRRQIAKLTHLETSTVAARCNKLIEIGQMVVFGTIKCPLSGKHVEAVKLASEQMEIV